MDTKEFIGKEVELVKRSEKFIVTNAEEKKTEEIVFYLRLSNDKEYLLNKKSLNSIIRFTDEEFNKSIEKILNPISPPPPPPPPPIPPNPYDFVIKRVLNVHNNEISKKNIAKGYSRFRDGGLVLEKCYGNVAQEMYVDGCKEFWWKYYNKSIFKKQGLFYAPSSTPEDYAVWFIPHSDLTVSVNDSGRWTNIYSKEYIYEVWHADCEYDADNYRVTFIKQGDGGYVFVGIYELCDIEIIDKKINNIDFKHIRIYKRVADTYPIIL